MNFASLGIQANSQVLSPPKIALVCLFIYFFILRSAQKGFIHGLLGSTNYIKS